MASLVPRTSFRRNRYYYGKCQQFGVGGPRRMTFSLAIRLALLGCATPGVLALLSGCLRPSD